MGSAVSKQARAVLAVKNNRELLRLFVIGQCLALKHVLLASLTSFFARHRTAVAPSAPRPPVHPLLSLLSSSVFQHLLILGGSAMLQRVCGPRLALWLVPALVFAAQRWYRTIPYAVLSFYQLNDAWSRFTPDVMRNQFIGVHWVASILIVVLTLLHPYTSVLTPSYKKFVSGLVGVPYADQWQQERLDLSNAVDVVRASKMWTLVPGVLYSDVTLASVMRGCLSSLLVTLRSILPSQLILLCIRRRRLPTDEEVMDVMRAVGWCAATGMVARLIVRIPSTIAILPMLVRGIIPFIWSWFVTPHVPPRMLNRINVFMISQILDGFLWKANLQDWVYPALLAFSIYQAIRSQLQALKQQQLPQEKQEKEESQKEVVEPEKSTRKKESKTGLNPSPSFNGLEALFVLSLAQSKAKQMDARVHLPH